MCAGGAGFDAFAAEDAFFVVEGEDGVDRESFGIVAPAAAEGTALEKHGGAYPVPVVNGEAFDVHDDSVFCR